jgi:hypothetical protein
LRNLDTQFDEYQEIDQIDDDDTESVYQIRNEVDPDDGFPLASPPNDDDQCNSISLGSFTPISKAAHYKSTAVDAELPDVSRGFQPSQVNASQAQLQQLIAPKTVTFAAPNSGDLNNTASPAWSSPQIERVPVGSDAVQEFPQMPMSSSPHTSQSLSNVKAGSSFALLHRDLPTSDQIVDKENDIEDDEDGDIVENQVTSSVKRNLERENDLRNADTQMPEMCDNPDELEVDNEFVEMPVEPTRDIPQHQPPYSAAPILQPSASSADVANSLIALHASATATSHGRTEQLVQTEEQVESEASEDYFQPIPDISAPSRTAHQFTYDLEEEEEAGEVERDLPHVEQHAEPHKQTPNATHHGLSRFLLFFISFLS